jgi:hypothetical protein
VIQRAARRRRGDGVERKDDLVREQAPSHTDDSECEPADEGSRSSAECPQPGVEAQEIEGAAQRDLERVEPEPVGCVMGKGRVHER